MLEAIVLHVDLNPLLLARIYKRSESEWQLTKDWVELGGTCEHARCVIVLLVVAVY